MMPTTVIISIVCFGAGAFALGGIIYLIQGAARAGNAQDRRTANVLTVALLAWASIALSAAYWGTLNFTTFLPFALVPIAMGSALTFQSNVATLLSRIPVHRIVLLQTYRVAGFIFAYLYYATGELSRGFALIAGWGDVLTGVLAIPVGWMLMKRASLAHSALIIWSLIGIGDLILAPTSALLFGAEDLVLFPLNTIPLFLGPPLGIFLHILTLRIYYLSKDASSPRTQLVTEG